MSAKQVVLITGISSGIGEATAKSLARIGYVVFGGQRSVFAAAEMQGVTVFPMDVRCDTSVRRGVDFVLEKAGGIDVVINNAGYALDGAVEETSLDEANALFETNFFGAARVIQTVLPILRRQRSGQIVNVSSAVGLFAVPFWGFYSASKFALEGYTEALRHEVRPFNIRVSLVEPGFTRTDLIHHGRNAENVLAEYEPWKKEGLAAIAPLGTFEGVDIGDRRLTEADLRGKTILISVSDQETADAAIEWQTRAGVEAGLTLGRQNDLFYLAVADVSRFPRLVKPIVRRRLHGIYEKMRQRLLERFAEKNQPPPPGLQDRVYLVPDWTGAIVQTLLDGTQRRLPELLVVDQQGSIVGRFTENTDASNQKMLALIVGLFSGASR